MKKILVTGGSGLLGGNLILDWQGRFSLYSVQLSHKINFKFCRQAIFDLAEMEKTIKFVKEAKPDCIVHTAAIVDVDYCESHENEARIANVNATENIAQAAQAAGAKLIYISTDSVFDGKKGNYAENEKTNPLNRYARSKLEGEKVAMEKCDNCSVVRTCIVGWNMQNKQSLSEWIYNGLKKGETMRLFDDVYFTPILVNNLGRAISELFENDFTGILNIAGAERISKFDFGKKLAKAFGFDQGKIVGSGIEEANLVAKRPRDASLNVSKAKKILETELLDVNGLLEEKRMLLESGFVQKLKSGISHG
jgi:dTDP-4-dehydrorhamnose reductase